MPRGTFITFEGGEGSGKSTQARLLAGHLRALNYDVVSTREPGGTPFAEAVRHLILSDATPRHGATAEALLFFAARADHLATLIRPALEAGRWVICDRFSDSTRVYQGAAGTMPREAIEALDRIVVGDTTPDLTLILDIEPAAGLARATERRGVSATPGTGVDPYEQRDLVFHQRLREGYLELARAAAGRCIVIDAAGTQEEVAQRVREAVTNRLKLARRAG